MENNQKIIRVAAEVDKLPEVLEFIEALLEETDCPPKAQMQINIAVDELFVNIASYAYPDGEGEAEIQVSVTPDAAVITFIDSGIPYDPLAKPDPDVTLSLEERQIGGLGIFMTKKLMDDIAYERRDGKNVLTITKKLS